MDVLDPRDADPTRLLAWLAIQRAFAFTPESIPEALRLEPALGPWLALPGVEPFGRAAGERLVARLAALGVRAVPLPSPSYPERIRRLPDAPALLFVDGTVALLGARAVAIVGARAATAYGRAQARRLAAALARAGLVIVSGLARGVDAAAHEGALAAGGATLAFQACGPDRVYPASHRSLAARIRGQGAVLTELPLGTPPRGPYFPLRNRLISGIAEAVIVVEGRVRSGSLVTARRAADQGTEVMAVPGPIDVATSEGPHALIRDGATLVRGPDDVLRALDIEVRDVAPLRRAAPTDALERRILRALRHEPLARDAVAARLGRAPAALAAALLRLELAGFIEEDRDGRLRARPQESP